MWRSKLQEFIATSTTEAEYVVASDAAKEALWHGRLACTFRQANLNLTLVIFSDSKGEVALAKNLLHHNALKIEVRYHFVRDCVTKGKLDLEKVSTTDSVADGMMKSLSANQFRSIPQ